MGTPKAELIGSVSTLLADKEPDVRGQVVVAVSTKLDESSCAGYLELSREDRRTALLALAQQQQAGIPELYQVNSAALLRSDCDSLLTAKLLVDLEDGSKQQVVGHFVVDSGCRGTELDLVLTKRKAEALGLKPFAGPGGEEVNLTARAANRTPMQIVKMWPQVIMLVPLYKHGQGEPAALRKSNLTVWAADVDILDGSGSGGSEGGAVSKASPLNADAWDDIVPSSSNGVDESVLEAAQEYSGDGYQALHSPITEEKHVALLGFSGLAKLGLKADFAHHLVYSVQPKGTIASVHSI